MKQILFFTLLFIITSSSAQTFLDSVRLGKKSMYEYVAKYNDTDKFDEEIITYKENGKCGFKDKKSKIIVSAKYDYVSNFQNNVAIVELKGKSALINKLGEFIIPFGRYDDIYIFKEKRARVKNNGFFGIVDEKGNEILPCVYKSCDNYRFGLCQLTNQLNKSGIVDLSGKIVIPFEYDNLVQMQLEGVIKAKKNQKYGYINYKNSTLINFDYEYIDQPVLGTIAVKKNKKFGFITATGKEISPCVFDTVYQFTEKGKAFVVRNGKYGTVALDGTVSIKE